MGSIKGLSNIDHEYEPKSVFARCLTFKLNVLSLAVVIAGFAVIVQFSSVQFIRHIMHLWTPANQ